MYPIVALPADSEKPLWVVEVFASSFDVVEVFCSSSTWLALYLGLAHWMCYKELLSELLIECPFPFLFGGFAHGRERCTF